MNLFRRCLLSALAIGFSLGGAGLSPAAEQERHAVPADVLRTYLYLSSQEPSGGAGPCHLAVDRGGKFVLAANATSAAWITLSDDLKGWQKPTADWFIAGGARIDAKNSRRLEGTPGKGVLINGKKGCTRDLISRQTWGDLEVALEFMIPCGSNSGVKLHGVYEIQILDSWKVAKPTGADCGGIYPRAELKPRYHHIDDGTPPLVNAARQPGQWQTLEIRFRAPRFDVKGNKVANAQFEKVVLNGKLIHDHAEVAHPTGAIWRDKEHATGPLLLQADHGPVAFRHVRVRPL